MSSAIFVILLVIGSAVSDVSLDYEYYDDTEFISHTESVPAKPSSQSYTATLPTTKLPQEPPVGFTIIENSTKDSGEEPKKANAIEPANVAASIEDPIKNDLGVNNQSITTNFSSPTPKDFSPSPALSSDESPAADTLKNVSENFSVPIELPANAFHCPDAETCIKNLTEHKNSADNDNIDTEVTDLRNDTVLREEAEIDNELNPSTNQQQINSSEIIDTETELIEDGENTEDKIRMGLAKEVLVEEAPGVPLIQGQLAAILAAVFVSVSVFAYVALLWWRRYLEHRYGSRQMLVSEEDFDDINDLRHFTI